MRFICVKAIDLGHTWVNVDHIAAVEPHPKFLIPSDALTRIILVAGTGVLFTKAPVSKVIEQIEEVSP